MNAKSIAALLVACSALLSVPAFAGGYGPTPDSRSDSGPPATRSGQTTPSTHISVVRKNHGGVGGSVSVRSQSDKRAPDDTIDPMYHGG